MFSETEGTVADLINRVFDPTITIADLGWLRDEWDGPIVIKGIQTVADAQAVVDAGMDAIVISNHGGRQLDRSPTPLEQLPAIAHAVGDRAEVFIDGGVLNGADIVAAVASGARAVLVGRAYLYGLMAGGERGVARAGELLRQEFVRTMQLLGVAASPIWSQGECACATAEISRRSADSTISGRPMRPRRWRSMRSIVLDTVADETLAGRVRQRWASIGLNVVAIAVALVLPLAAVGLYLIVTLVALVLPLIRLRRHQT